MLSGASAVIPAAGRGERFGRGQNKVFTPAAGIPLLGHTLGAFERSESISEIVVVVGAHELDEARAVIEGFGLKKIKAVVAGGGHRQDSVRLGIEAASPDTEIIAVHDGARCLVTPEVIESTIAEARASGAAVAAVPVIDTIKTATPDGLVDQTLDRDRLWAIQTPQTFCRDLITRAMREATEAGFYATDDAALVERVGHGVKLVMGSYDNIKVTTPRDLEYVESKLGGRVKGEIRTGFGYDIHRFLEGRRLFLGGVEFPGETGLDGHSDADVILHAIADAMLGAAALGDIGVHFPNTDPRFKGSSSLLLLEHTAGVLKSAGWQVVNVDSTLVSERPKIMGRALEMREKIGASLGIDSGRVSIKATTAEKLGDIGRGDGAACYAIATIERI